MAPSFAPGIMLTMAPSFAPGIMLTMAPSFPARCGPWLILKLWKYHACTQGGKHVVDAMAEALLMMACSCLQAVSAVFLPFTQRPLQFVRRISQASGLLVLPAKGLSVCL
jgi:hypothetical protein